MDWFVDLGAGNSLLLARNGRSKRGQYTGSNGGLALKLLISLHLIWNILLIILGAPGDINTAVCLPFSYFLPVP